MINLQGRHFLKLLDFSGEEIEYLIDLSLEYKEKKSRGENHQDCKGKNIVLLFEKTSTRTRCSFEVAAYDLGMQATYLDPQGSQMGHKESIEDTAKVLGRYYDGIEYRGYGQDIVEELAEHAGVPVWNGLTTEFHPTQMIADMMTVKEHFGDLKGRKLAYLGDCRNNVSNSLMVVCAKLGLDYVACGPKSLWPQEDLVNTCKEIAADTGSTILLTEDQEEGPKEVDVVYTDVWVSMGEEKDVWEDRIRLLTPYQVNEKLFTNAKNEAVFMHCLPSFHDTKTTVGKDIYDHFGLEELEVTDEVFRSDRSIVFDQAENRMHSIKAIMAATLK